MTPANKRCLTVQQVIDELQKAQDKSVPCFVWINSQLEEPVYTGGERIPIVHVDDNVDGLIDLNCEGYEQCQIWDRVYTHICEQHLSVPDTQMYLADLIDRYDPTRLTTLDQYELAWLRCAHEKITLLVNDMRTLVHTEIVKAIMIATTGRIQGAGKCPYL